jgi:type II secretory pathway pseudopilin PulG
MCSNSTSDQRGVVLLTVLVFILVTTLAASSLIQMHQTQMQREREEQLLFVGDQFRKAIASYYNTIPPGGARGLPQSLEALLNDQRFPKPRQHLRRIYPDPMTGQADWQLIRESGGIVGVKSQSDHPTLKKRGFSKEYLNFEEKGFYSDWSFSIRDSLPSNQIRR